MQRIRRELSWSKRKSARAARKMCVALILRLVRYVVVMKRIEVYSATIGRAKEITH